MRNFFKIIVYFFLFSLFVSCGQGFFKKVDTRKVPIKGTDRARKNVEEGRGFKLGDIGKNRATNYEFSTSNPMWRASLDILDFLPLVTVDYSGGMIISDWYYDGLNKNDSIKITIRFLSNEVKTNSLNIVVHKKTCITQNQCLVKKISSQIEDELKISILKKAALY